MSMGTSGSDLDQNFPIFPLCINPSKNYDPNDDTPFDLHCDLKDDTIQQIMDSYLVENTSSFAIQEFIDNCIQLSRQLFSYKKGLFSCHALNQKFLTDDSFKKRRKKIKNVDIPEGVKSVLGKIGQSEPDPQIEKSTEEGKTIIEIKIPSESEPRFDGESDRIYKMLLIHNIKTYINRAKYSEEQENKKNGVVIDKIQKMKDEEKEKKKKEKAKGNKVSKIHRFGGKVRKKGMAVDVCIKVKGEDGTINEIIVKGEKKKKKKVNTQEEQEGDQAENEEEKSENPVEEAKTESPTEDEQSESPNGEGESESPNGEGESESKSESKEDTSTPGDSFESKSEESETQSPGLTKEQVGEKTVENLQKEIQEGKENSEPIEDINN